MANKNLVPRADNDETLGSLLKHWLTVFTYHLHTTDITDGTKTVAVADIPTAADIAAKAPLASPALTGTPTAPTAAEGTNTTQLATTAFVKANAPAFTATANTAGKFDAGTTTPTGTTRLNYSGYLYATKVYAAVYNDYAEYFPLAAGETYEVGDVISVHPEGDSHGYRKSRKGDDTLVVGVVSGEYAQCIGGDGDGHDDEHFIPVALAGRVHVKVVGHIRPGDLLTTSDLPGVATKSYGKVNATVLGKALDSHNGAEVGLIRMLVMRT